MHVWYITFHGGEGEHAWNNIHVFDTHGRPMGKALDTHSLPDSLELRELRGFTFGPGGDLFVANAYTDASQVLRFAGKPDAEGKHAFREVFVEQHKANPGLAHPFDVAFGPDDNLYVPSQDTNVVGRYYGPGSSAGQPGAPMPHPEALRDAGAERVLPGTFVPSEKHHPSGVRTVRRAIFGPDRHLYVADRDSNSVKRYHGKSGALQQEYRHEDLTKPVHLAFRPHDGALLVGSRDGHAVFAIEPKLGQDLNTHTTWGWGIACSGRYGQRPRRQALRQQPRRQADPPFRRQDGQTGPGAVHRRARGFPGVHRAGRAELTTTTHPNGWVFHLTLVPKGRPEPTPDFVANRPS